MKIIGIEEQENKRKLNTKKVFFAGIIILALLLFIILFVVYSSSQAFRDLIDKYVLMKNIIEDSTASILIDENDNDNIFAYDKYICIYNKNTLINYNSYGKEEGKLTIDITTPEISTNGRYVLIGEKDLNKEVVNLYLISGNEIMWQKEMEGKIDKLSVNKNGYVAVVLSGTSHKSVIQIYNNMGDELFKIYLSSTIAMDVDISTDNQYLSFLEVNTNGTSVQSTIKTISIQKAKQKSKDTSVDPIVYTHSEDDGRIILNIKYQDGNKLLCMYDDSIDSIKGEEMEPLFMLTEDGQRCSFADIELNNSVYRIFEKTTLLTTQTNVEIINTSLGNKSSYSLSGVVKEVSSYGDTIAINIGSEIHFISTNGWLIKKYISNQEIKKVVICNNFAGIVYRNKIEIVNF